MKHVVTLALLFAVTLPLGMVLVSSTDFLPGETISQWVWFDRTAPIAACCVLAAILIASASRQRMPDPAVLLSAALLLWGGVEAAWGLGQIFGFTASGHSLYALTGSFFNPGPYAGYLAMVLPVCLHSYLTTDRKWIRLASGSAGLLILCVLPASMSRTAWIAGASGCLWVWLSDKKASGLHRIIYDKLRLTNRKRKLAAGGGLICAAILAGGVLFMLKPDSARGRIFLWRMSAKASLEQPLTGHGRGNFAPAYGTAQETYFATKNYESWEERVAGSPAYAFNEYLQIAVEYGWPALAGLLAVTAVCLYRGTRQGKHGICGSILALMVFAFSSYPLQIPAFTVTGTTLLLAAATNGRRREWITLTLLAGLYGSCRLTDDRHTEQACREWVRARMLYQTGAYAAAEEAYSPLLPLLKDRGDFLFEYGHGLHRQGKYQEADRILQMAARRSNDPMILNILGKNAWKQGKYAQAEKWLWKAVHRLPGRIYPYYLLAELYADPAWRQKKKFEQMRRIVLTKEPKVMSTAIREMRDELKSIVIE